MKFELLAYLVCPVSKGKLELEIIEQLPDGEIISGNLFCAKSGLTYPIVRGIPRMLPNQIADDKEKTAAAFGWQWQEFTEMHAEYREQFLDWIYPLQPEFFSGKVVLDAGCGIGRHSYWSSQFGAKAIIGIDLSEAVETAYQNVGRLPNAHVVQADIFQLPFLEAEDAPFDFIYSIGVLHHTPDPEKSFHSLVRQVKPGGAIFAWVYGHENNGIIHYAIDPVRKNLTRYLPPKVLYYLSYLPTAVLQVLLKAVYKPINQKPGLKKFQKYLFYNSYFSQLSGYNFRHNHTIVFDHLVAPTAFYIKKADFENWFKKAGLTGIELSWRNQNSWRGRGVKPFLGQSHPKESETVELKS
jgi:SAM-dependent methyltransferase